MRSTLLLLLASTLAGAALLSTWTTHRSAQAPGGHPGPVDHAEAGGRPGVATDGVSTVREPVRLAARAQAAPDAEILEEALERGAKPWSEVARDLAGLLRLNEEARAGVVRSAVGWPEALTSEYIQERFRRRDPLDARALNGIREVVRPFNEDLTARGEEYAVWLDLSLREVWNTGDFLREPLQGADVTVALGRPGERSLYLASAVCGGWAVRMDISAARFPHVAEMRNALSGLRRDRDRAVARHLAPPR